MGTEKLSPNSTFEGMVAFRKSDCKILLSAFVYTIIRATTPLQGSKVVFHEIDVLRTVFLRKLPFTTVLKS